MKPIMIACLFFLFSTGSQTVLAEDPQNHPQEGKSLHDAHCSKCHGSAVYTRKDRRITTAAQLEAQVRRCEGQLDLQWFDEDVDAVVDYLNKAYYHFK